MCELFGKKPTDPEIMDMDDITWSWFYASWLEKREEKTKFAKSLGCFIGSFFNPAAAKQIQDADDGNNAYSLSDDEFDASTEYVKNMIEEQKKNEKQEGKRKKRKLKITENNGT